MRRKMTAIMIAVALSAVALTAFAEITFVLKNGERITGTGITRSQGTITVSVNGQERKLPMGEVAMVIYNGGEPAGREIAQLPMSDNPPELERHTLILRDGRVIRGQADDWNPDRLVFDTAAGRQFFNAADISRLYMVSGPQARRLFAGRAGTTGEAGAGGGGRRGEADATVTVEANRPWTDTGLVVHAGERIAFNANGTITVVENVQTGPDGQRDMARSPNFPIRNMSIGGLIGRVGNSRPFAIGSTRSPIEMPVDGRLFLGINDDIHTDNTGTFEVRIFRR